MLLFWGDLVGFFLSLFEADAVNYSRFVIKFKSSYSLFQEMSGIVFFILINLKEKF